MAPVAKYERVLDSGGAAVQLWSIGLPGREFTEPSLRQTSALTAQAATSTQPKDKKGKRQKWTFRQKGKMLKRKTLSLYQPSAA